MMISIEKRYIAIAMEMFPPMNRNLLLNRFAVYSETMEAIRLKIPIA